MNRVARRLKAGAGLNERGDGTSRCDPERLAPVASFVSPTALPRGATRFTAFSAAASHPSLSVSSSFCSVPPFVSSGLSVLSGTLCVFAQRVVASWHRRHLPRGSHAVQSSRVRSLAHGSRRLRLVRF